MNYLKHVHVPHSCGRVHAPSVDAIKDVHWFDWSKYEKFYFKFKFGLFFNLSLKRGILLQDTGVLSHQLTLET